MSIRSVDMTNAKSTLAVSAIILGGLLAASPFPYPRAPEAHPRPVAVAAVPDFLEPAAPVAWTDPPARAPAPAVPATVASAAVPEMPSPVVAAEATAPTPTVATRTADRAAAKLAAKRAEQARRRKLALAARGRQSAPKPGTASETAGSEQQVAAATAPSAAPADPITSLLRGLGFGRQG